VKINNEGYIVLFYFQYYYNAQTTQFLYWDADKSTYLPAPTGEDGTPREEIGDKKKDKEKKEKVKIAKKIAKVGFEQQVYIYRRNSMDLFYS